MATRKAADSGILLENVPIYLQIRQFLLHAVSVHADPARRLMSERELCAKFGVNRITVRRALRDLVDSELIIVKPGSGVYINPEKLNNRHFFLRNSYKVLVIIGYGRHVDYDGFFLNIMARIYDQLKCLPTRVKFIEFLFETDAMLSEIMMHMPDGVLWVHPPESVAGAIADLRQHVPVYTVGEAAIGDPCNITMDYRAAGRLAASWLLENGGKRLMFVGNLNSHHVRSEVFAGWTEEYSAHGWQHDENLRLDSDTDIRKRAKKLLKTGEIDGIFVFGSEFAAIDLVFSELKLAPDAVPVILDENYFATFEAYITPAAKIQMFSSRVPEIAALNLFHKMRDPGFISKEVVLSPSIVS
jgi:DNA-binding LacI/PurR family transcriptional regulator